MPTTDIADSIDDAGRPISVLKRWAIQAGITKTTVAGRRTIASA